VEEPTVGAYRGAANFSGNSDMPALACAAPSIVLQTGPEQLKVVAARILKAFARPEDYRPAKVKIGDLRQSARAPVSVPVQIASVIMANGNAEVLDVGVSGEVVDLSLHGLSLTHSELFMHFFCLVTFSLPTSESISMVAEILWTIRETKDQFRSGGRFVGVIENM
jgi:PilZ domain